MTIVEIAKKAGVSCATVSRVINNTAPVKKETRAKIQAVINEFNFSPNSISNEIAKIAQNTIAVIVPDITNPFFAEVIKGINLEADIHNFDTTFYDTDENQEKEVMILKKLKTMSIKGLIISPTTDTNEFNGEYLKLLESIGIPIYLVDRDVKYSNFDGVFVDNVKGAFDATCALINEGHRDIAIIAGPKSSKPGRDRLRGYKKAFLMNNIELKENLIFYGDYRMESGYELTDEILSLKKRPTAIFACNNLMSLGALKSINENQLKIPDDIALIIFDEIEILNILGMKISNVYRPTQEMGRIAMDNLSEKIKNTNNIVKNQTDTVTLIPTLKLLGSEKLIVKKEHEIYE
ncbi:LacI family DNA-binding transcriptional regulator [Clostridium sp.]|uniref:LacI family DNA-binding transcriptional regulator n=1 Tax=Clostridium sp. TaxID=1506 RepID=UPI0025C46379|nr:LacI family DNA-binding transcriptional regulator [Clostridium sp.]